MKPGFIRLLAFTFVVISVIILTAAIFKSGGGENPTASLEEFRRMPPDKQISFLKNKAKTRTFSEIKNFIREAYPDEPHEKHDLAHVLGEIAIEYQGLEGFSLCDELLNFGCFHGAALESVNIYGRVAELAEKLHKACLKSDQSPGSCFHGLGHAVLILKNYDLVAAHEECERIVVEPDDAFWCQDGVAMENITRSMAPPTLGAYENDAASSCHTLPIRYQPVCARNRLGWLEDNKGVTAEEARNFCLSFSDEETSRECIRTLEARRTR